MSITFDKRDAVRRPISHRWLAVSLFAHGSVMLILMQFAGGSPGVSAKNNSGEDSIVVTWIPGGGDGPGDGGGAGTLDTVVEEAEPSEIPGGKVPIEVVPEPEKKPVLDVAETDPKDVFQDRQVAAFIIDPDSKASKPRDSTQPQENVPEPQPVETDEPAQNRPESPPPTNSTVEQSREKKQDAADGSGEGGSSSGQGGGKGAAGGNGSNGIKFFGILARARKVVYVIDASESMKNHRAMEIARKELFQSLKGLEQAAQFQIIFFDSQPHVMNGTRGPAKLMLANPRNLVQAEQFAKGIEPESGTDRFAAISLALGFHPDVIFVLTDADDPKLSPQDLFDIKKMNKRRTSINVVEFGIKADLSSDSFLKQLARENGGQHFYRDLTRKTN